MSIQTLPTIFILLLFLLLLWKCALSNASGEQKTIYLKFNSQNKEGRLLELKHPGGFYMVELFKWNNSNSSPSAIDLLSAGFTKCPEQVVKLQFKPPAYRKNQENKFTFKITPVARDVHGRVRNLKNQHNTELLVRHAQFTKIDERPVLQVVTNPRANTYKSLDESPYPLFCAEFKVILLSYLIHASTTDNYRLLCAENEKQLFSKGRPISFQSKIYNLDIAKYCPKMVFVFEKIQLVRDEENDNVKDLLLLDYQDLRLLSNPENKRIMKRKPMEFRTAEFKCEPPKYENMTNYYELSYDLDTNTANCKLWTLSEDGMFIEEWQKYILPNDEELLFEDGNYIPPTDHRISTGESSTMGKTNEDQSVQQQQQNQITTATLAEDNKAGSHEALLNSDEENNLQNLHWDRFIHHTPQLLDSQQPGLNFHQTSFAAGPSTQMNANQMENDFARVERERKGKAILITEPNNAGKTKDDGNSQSRSHNSLLRNIDFLMENPLLLSDDFLARQNRQDVLQQSQQNKYNIEQQREQQINAGTIDQAGHQQQIRAKIQGANNLAQKTSQAYPPLMASSPADDFQQFLQMFQPYYSALTLLLQNCSLSSTDRLWVYQIIAIYNTILEKVFAKEMQKILNLISGEELQRLLQLMQSCAGQRSADEIQNLTQLLMSQQNLQQQNLVQIPSENLQQTAEQQRLKMAQDRNEFIENSNIQQNFDQNLIRQGLEGQHRMANMAQMMDSRHFPVQSRNTASSHQHLFPPPHPQRKRKEQVGSMLPPPMNMHHAIAEHSKSNRNIPHGFQNLSRNSPLHQSAFFPRNSPLISDNEINTGKPTATTHQNMEKGHLKAAENIYKSNMPTISESFPYSSLNIGQKITTEDILPHEIQNRRNQGMQSWRQPSFTNKGAPAEEKEKNETEEQESAKKRQRH